MPGADHVDAEAVAHSDRDVADSLERFRLREASISVIGS